MVYSENWKILDWDGKKSVPELQMTKLGFDLFGKYKWEEHEVERTGFLYEQNRTKWDAWRKRKEEYENSF